MAEDLAGRINELKSSIQTLWDKIADNEFELARRKISDVSQKVQEKLKSRGTEISDAGYDNDYDHNYADDLPLTVLHDDDTLGNRNEGVKYATTENSPLSAGKEKVEAVGIDKFGDEKDTFDFDEADDFQDNRNRNQNSDLADRFRTPGLSTKDIQ